MSAVTAETVFSIPSPAPISRSSVTIFSDFDGTISDKDSLKFLLNHYGASHWQNVEDQMSSGEMAEREGLPKAFENFPLSWEMARAFVLKNVKIDPTFKAFAEWCRLSGHSLSVLSGGFEGFIKPLLARENLQHIPVLANDVKVEKSKWNVTPCATRRLCSLCNHCKTSSLVEAAFEQPESLIVYIGDGHTDTCPVEVADVVFAKSYLKEYCEKKNIRHIPFSNFQHVLDVLSDRLRTDTEFQARSFSALKTL